MSLFCNCSYKAAVAWSFRVSVWFDADFNQGWWDLQIPVQNWFPTTSPSSRLQVQDWRWLQSHDVSFSLLKNTFGHTYHHCKEQMLRTCFKVTVSFDLIQTPSSLLLRLFYSISLCQHSFWQDSSKGQGYLQETGHSHLENDFLSASRLEAHIAIYTETLSSESLLQDFGQSSCSHC